MSVPKNQPKEGSSSSPAEATEQEKENKMINNAPIWEDFWESLPDWADEIIAFSLSIFGILSLVSLLIDSNAVVAIAWANIMSLLFGVGAALISLGIFLLGLLMILPKLNIKVSLSISRILALEIAFLAVLALLHLFVEDDELLAIARNGQGGGIVGFALTVIPFNLMGRILAITLFILIFIISLGFVFGIQRKQFMSWLNNLQTKLKTFGQNLRNPNSTLDGHEKIIDLKDVLLMSKERIPLMRIRVDMERIPPSLRKQLEQNPQQKEILDEEILNHPLFSNDRDGLKTDFNLVGEPGQEKDEEGFLLVERPDGRIKRYFPVSQRNEKQRPSRRRPAELPSIDLLSNTELNIPDEEEINVNVALIENTLLEFDIDIDIVDVQVGPTVTRYAIKPYKTNKMGDTERTRLKKIASYHNDLSLALSAKRLRMEIPVPGTNYMGVEVPNKVSSLVSLRSVWDSNEFYEQSQKSQSPLFVPLGRDVAGYPIGLDLASLPHLLIAGTTGSGKSVAIAAIAAAILLDNQPDQVKMIMLDPKMVELSRFNGIPHLLGPVETDPTRIIEVLSWCTQEMDRRYRLLEDHQSRNITTYNERFGKRKGYEFMPYILILVDEIGDLMMSYPDETERSITRLAQMARAVGMHLVIATQRPSTDVITGLIKANFPARMSFAVASGIDSRVIIDSVGAETLLGRGDMLYQDPSAAGPRRIQGCFIDDEEVRKIVNHWRLKKIESIDKGALEDKKNGPWERSVTKREFLSETDDMLEDAIKLVIRTQEASASQIQRELNIGYPRAARLMDLLSDLGVVGEPVGGGKARRVLIEPGGDPFKTIIDKQLRKKQTPSNQDTDDLE
ncbi:hypothetical protein MASR2M15_06030 [Anaerolineales bacterium]